MTGSVRTRTRECPRCGGSHDATAQPLAGTPPRLALPWGVREMTHWYTCPETGHPVLLALEPVPVAPERVRE